VAAARGARVAPLTAARPGAGEPLRTPPLEAWRDAIPYEGLRHLAESHGERPRAVMLRLDSLPATFASADLARQLLLAAGLLVLEPRPLVDPTEAGQVWRSELAEQAAGMAAGAAAGVVVPGRRTGAEELLAACHSLRAAGCETVVAVGRRADPAADGADLWLEEGADALAAIEALLGRLEVLA
jgi:hypothetical protein